MHSTHPVTVGVLGGQGALASATFVHRFVSAWPISYRCQDDTDFPRVFHLSEALPGLSLEGVEDPSAALEALLVRAAALKKQGVDFLVLPCNSLEFIAREVQEISGLWTFTPLGAAITNRPHDTVTVLASPSTAFVLSGARPPAWEVLAEDLQPEVNAAIKAVMCGDLAQGQKHLDKVVASVSAQGRTALLACTELSCLRALPNCVDAMGDLLAFVLRFAGHIAQARRNAPSKS